MASPARPVSPTTVPSPLETVGGDIDTPAYALLTGLDTECSQTVAWPVRVLPAILGRSHATEDPHFVDMGKLKAISRQHMRIDCRATAEGILKTQKDKIVYEALRLETLVPESSKWGDRRGVFCVTCLGKNRIVVDGERLEQGQTAVLRSGSKLKVGSNLLYFLLPKEASTASIEIAAGAKKKKKRPLLTASAAAPAAKKSNKSKEAWPTLQNDIDNMSTDDLLEQISSAIEGDVWERRHQLMGSTVSYRAVLAAAEDPEIQRQAEVGGGASRSDIMKWIAESERFGKWVDQMLGKLEDKSYQASITKALIKAGFSRTASSGRYIKWVLPADIGQQLAAAGGGEASKSDVKDHDNESDAKEAAEDDDDGGCPNEGEDGEVSAPGGKEDNEDDDGGEDEDDNDEEGEEGSNEDEEEGDHGAAEGEIAASGDEGNESAEATAG